MYNKHYILNDNNMHLTNSDKITPTHNRINTYTQSQQQLKKKKKTTIKKILEKFRKPIPFLKIEVKKMMTMVV